MARTYYLTASASDLSVPGVNFDNDLNETGPSATTISITVSAGGQEIDYGFTLSGNPGTDGATGDFTATIVLTTEDADMGVRLRVARVNSSGTLQTQGNYASEGEQAMVSGPVVFTWTSENLGTWASGDRLRLEFEHNGNQGHGNATIDYTISASGTRILTPFTAPAAAPSNPMLLGAVI